jgi:hypothetical protein
LKKSAGGFCPLAVFSDRPLLAEADGRAKLKPTEVGQNLLIAVEFGLPCSTTQ